MALWGKTSDKGRQGLDFRTDQGETKPYHAQVLRELARHFGALAVVALLAVWVLPSTPPERAAAPLLPAPVSTAPLEIASAY